MPSIETNIALNSTEKQYYQRFVNLSVNEEPLPQGDATIRITPFDDFFLFTLFDEIGGEDTPIDLSNVGDIFINFIGSSDDIDIKNHTQVEEVNLSQGQVLFKISRSDSKKILALDNQNFYISTRMEDENGVSDESVLYTGTFLNLQDSVQQNMTDKLNAQALLYSRDLAGKQRIIDNYKTTLAEMISLDEDQTATISGLEASNLELTNELAILTEQLGSTESELALKNAQLIAQRAERLKKKRSQIRALTKKAAALVKEQRL